MIELMKVFNSDNCSLSPHCWDHVPPEGHDLTEKHKESVLVWHGKTYWPASLLQEWEAIIAEAIQEIEDSGGWVPTISRNHKSIAWKLYTYKGIELHLSVTQDIHHKYWVHAYPTEKQRMSGRHVLRI